MILGHHIKRYLLYSAVASIAYAVPLWLYLNKSDFSQSWLLYLGNFLFGIAIAFFVFAFYRNNPRTRSISKMAIAAHLTTIFAVLFSIGVCLILLLLLKPEVFGPEPSKEELIRAAPQMENQKNDGLIMILLVNAVIGNAATGFFMAILFPFSIMRNQKGNKEGENLGPGQIATKTQVDSLDQVKGEK